MGSAGGLLHLVLCLLWLEEAVSLPLERTSVSGARARYGFRSRKDWWARFHRKGFLKSSSRQAVLQDSGLQNSSSSPLPSSSPASHPSSIGHMSDSSSAVAQTTVVPIAAVPTEPAELQHTSRTEALGALVEPTGPATEHYPSSSELHLVEATGGSTEHYASSTEGHGGLVEATGGSTEHYASSTEGHGGLVEATGGSTEHYASSTEGYGGLVEATGPGTEHYPSSTEAHLVEATGGSTEHYASSTEGHRGVVEPTGPGTEHYASSTVGGSKVEMDWVGPSVHSTKRYASSTEDHMGLVEATGPGTEHYPSSTEVHLVEATGPGTEHYASSTEGHGGLVEATGPGTEPYASSTEGHGGLVEATGPGTEHYASSTEGHGGLVEATGPGTEHYASSTEGHGGLVEATGPGTERYPSSTEPHLVEATGPGTEHYASSTEGHGGLVEATGPGTERYPSSTEPHLVEATGPGTEHYASSTEGHGGLVEATGPGTEHYPSSPVAGSTRNQMGWQHAAEQSTSRSPPVQSSSATGPINSADLCDFESDLCNWTQSAADEFDWSLHRERPVSKVPCHSKPGQYLYIQAAFPLQSGQTAVLQSGELSGEVCLSFWYSIFGAGVGSLAVYMQSLTFPSGQHRVWSDSGSESRLWYLEKLDISGVGMEKYRILFVGTIGNSYCGDAALDDVQVQKGVCLPQHRPLHFRRGQRSVPSPTPGTTASSNATSLFCSFEGSLCGWTQCQRDSFDWRLHAPLVPRQENCIQEREQYLYIMAAFPRAHGQTAVLMSPVLQESVCLSFWYSILGRGVGSLTVYMLYADTPDDWHKLWVGRGSGRRTWAWAEVELYMEPGKTFQILLEGIIQEASCGDAAVDDIRVERRRCSRK
ncbi:uncharacterized protein [Lepisosteus oculatus]|uniref:uncharacterized protein isoform X2 n=1 Tax=Lepisosteus oculatus TaxID=7918 RepID=UPI0035F51F57